MKFFTKRRKARKKAIDAIEKAVVKIIRRPLNPARRGNGAKTKSPQNWNEPLAMQGLRI